MVVSAIDAGNYETKFYAGQELKKFPSILGFDYRDRNIRDHYDEYDFEWEYRGQRGFAGTLALYESECAESQKGETKAHPDARLRILIALHQFADGIEHNIVVGQPISKHNEIEKKAIKDMLLGRHDLTVNGKAKTIVVRRCEVAAEGVTAGLLVASSGVVRVIDVGSGTVNLGTLLNRRLNDLSSYTLPSGMETMRNLQPEAFARQIALKAIGMKWGKNDTVYICGGGTTQLMEPLRTYFPLIGAIDSEPQFCNVRAFYMIARKIYEG